jgi:hypothetical protein
VTPPDDYVSEMMAQSRIDDDTAEALLTGRTVSAELEPLAEVVRAYRRLADEPVPPTAELAHQMSVGLFTRTAECVPPANGNGNRRRRRHERRRRWTPARTVMVSLLAGAAMLVTVVGTAGLAGVLPDPAQNRFETVVESVTPLELRKRADEDAEHSEYSEHPEDADNRENAEFGEDVSEDAQDDGVDGDETSERAREQGSQDPPAAPPAQVPEEPGPPPELPPPANENNGRGGDDDDDDDD